MAKLVWDKTGERLYETGVKKGVLYPMVAGAYPAGVAWNGVTAFTESPSGAEPTKLYADDINYVTLTSAEEYGFTLEAYTYPEEWEQCDGSASPVKGVSLGQQGRTPFGFTCVTTVGNDALGDNYGYKLHLVWNALAGVSEKAYVSINDSPEAITFSWECTTTPTEVEGFKPTASMVIDSTKVDADKLAALEAILYGGDDTEARLPLPLEVLTTLGYVKEDDSTEASA